jgi:hypothetical protein
MKWLYIIVIVVMLAAATACGGAQTKDARSPTGESTGATGQPTELDGDPDAAPSVPCETSDDCAPSQICVDDECAIPVPAGFY